MEAYAQQEGFPIVGPTVGGWLEQLARIRGAERIFEFGSGFGYSAYWFARALPSDGEIVLTELDERNLERAREYLDRGDVCDPAVFEVGHAVETARTYDGPFDVALFDIEKYEYVDAFDAIRDSIRPGGMIVADNTMSAGRERPDDTVAFDPLRRVLTGEVASLADTDVEESARRGTQGIVDYVERLRDDPAFETTMLPLGDGVTVSTRTRDG